MHREREKKTCNTSEIPEWLLKGKNNKTEKTHVQIAAVKQASSQTLDWHLSAGCTADKKITALTL